jgi:hypothetical protein
MENEMRNLLLAISGGVLVLSTGIATERANAFVQPGGVLSVIDEMAIVDNVHCRPGRRHHVPTFRYRADGCRRPTREDRRRERRDRR